MSHWWYKVLAVLGAVAIVVGLYVEPYNAAHQATQSAIKSAEAAQNTKGEQQQLRHLQQAEAGIQSLLSYVASVQNGAAGKAARDATGYYVGILKAICVAVHCKAPPEPPGV